jgi:hypothetical protein
VRDLLAREVESYEVTFTGLDPRKVATPLLAVHTGSDAAWVQVGTDQRDDLIRELSDRGARLVGLMPVQNTLEDLLMQQYEEGAAS